eukprot:403342624
MLVPQIINSITLQSQLNLHIQAETHMEFIELKMIQIQIDLIRIIFKGPRFKLKDLVICMSIYLQISNVPIKVLQGYLKLNIIYKAIRKKLIKILLLPDITNVIN